MATLATVFGGASLATGGKKAKDANQGPPINASSPDEEKFIKYVPSRGYYEIM
jgi:F-type H+-transporting ATPase subunit k